MYRREIEMHAVNAELLAAASGKERWDAMHGVANGPGLAAYTCGRRVRCLSVQRSVKKQGRFSNVSHPGRM